MALIVWVMELHASRNNVNRYELALERRVFQFYVPALAQD